MSTEQNTFFIYSFWFFHFSYQGIVFRYFTLISYVVIVNTNNLPCFISLLSHYCYFRIFQKFGPLLTIT